MLRANLIEKRRGDKLFAVNDGETEERVFDCSDFSFGFLQLLLQRRHLSTNSFRRQDALEVHGRRRIYFSKMWICAATHLLSIGLMSAGRSALGMSAGYFDTIALFTRISRTAAKRGESC